jgi:hypothetical protein
MFSGVSNFTSSVLADMVEIRVTLLFQELLEHILSAYLGFGDQFSATSVSLFVFLEKMLDGVEEKRGRGEAVIYSFPLSLIFNGPFKKFFGHL